MYINLFFSIDLIIKGSKSFCLNIIDFKFKKKLFQNEYMLIMEGKTRQMGGKENNDGWEIQDRWVGKKKMTSGKETNDGWERIE